MLHALLWDRLAGGNVKALLVGLMLESFVDLLLGQLLRQVAVHDQAELTWSLSVF